MSDAPSRWARKPPAWLVGDVAAIGALLAFRAWFQPRWSLGHAGGDAPWWASPFDLLLSGPDAGPWASAALGLSGGNIADIDPHRLPTWTVLTSIVMWLGLDDVVLAGHLVNHLCSFAFPVAVYALGRRMGLGGLAFAAAAMSMASMHMSYTASHFGIDGFVALAVPLLLVTASFAGRHRAVAVGAGVVGGMCAIGHLSTLGFPICGAILAASMAPPKTRLRTAGLYVAGVVGAVLAIYSWYPTLPESEVLTVFAEGIVQTNSVTPDEETAREHLSQAGEVVSGGLGTAIYDVINRLLPVYRPRLVPWAVALFLPWLGLWAPGLAKGGWKDRSTWLGPLWIGLPVATALAPLVALAAAQAEDRYLYNFAPLYLLFLCRGAASLMSLVERLLPGWAGGLLAALAGAAIGLDVLREPPFPARIALDPYVEHEDRMQLELGRDLKSLPPRTFVISLQREALAYAGLRQCLLADCPSDAQVASFEACVERARTECSGDGPIPYIAVSQPDPRRVPEPRVAMDAWVRQSFPVDHTVQADGETIAIHHIPRD